MFPFVFEINPAGWVHLAYFGLLIPVLVVRGLRFNKMHAAPVRLASKWTMNQYGGNLEIRTARADRCMEVMRADKGIYGEVKQRPCNSSINQRWKLYAKTLNRDGVICRASPSHPDYNCYGSNENQKQVYLGKTLTKARCEEACKATNMVSCKWEGSQ